MDQNELRNTAYRIASSNSLCASLSTEQLETINDDDLMDLAWEPFENWAAGEMREHIDRMAQDIIDAFSSVVT